MAKRDDFLLCFKLFSLIKKYSIFLIASQLFLFLRGFPSTSMKGLSNAINCSKIILVKVNSPS